MVPEAATIIQCPTCKRNSKRVLEIIKCRVCGFEGCDLCIFHHCCNCVAKDARIKEQAKEIARLRDELTCEFCDQEAGPENPCVCMDCHNSI